MKIEKAEKHDLESIVDVIQDSIINLCHKDHLNKNEHLQAWLTERSEQNLQDILFNSHSRTFICICDGRIAGMSHIDNSGELKLCYVHSQYTGKGIGRLLLEAAEQQAKAWGLVKITMTSTTTAMNFYLSQGYTQNGEQIMCIGMPGHPLAKNI